MVEGVRVGKVDKGSKISGVTGGAKLITVLLRITGAGRGGREVLSDDIEVLLR